MKFSCYHATTSEMNILMTVSCLTKVTKSSLC